MEGEGGGGGGESEGGGGSRACPCWVVPAAAGDHRQAAGPGSGRESGLWPWVGGEGSRRKREGLVALGRGQGGRGTEECRQAGQRVHDADSDRRGWGTAEPKKVSESMREEGGREKEGSKV